MIVPVVVDELTASNSFDEFLDDVSSQYGIKVKEDELAGIRVASLTRPSTPDSSCAIHDECSLVVATEECEVILKSIDRIYEYNTTYCPIEFVPDGEVKEVRRPVYVEEKLPGIQVVVSKFDLTHVISTETHPLGETLLPGNSRITAAEFFLQEIKKSQPTKGINALFNNWFSYFSWVFQIVPRKYNNYDLYLLAAVNMDSGEEVPRNQVNNLAMHFDFKRPEKVTIYKEEQLDDAIKVLLNINPSMEGVILINHKDQRAQIPLKANSKLGLYQNGSRKEILALADCVMQRIKLDNFEASGVVYILNNNMFRLQREARILYKLNKHRRTKKNYALKVKHHPMAKVLFALRENKIESVKELHKILTPFEFVKMIGLVAGDSLKESIVKYKEKTCPKQ